MVDEVATLAVSWANGGGRCEAEVFNMARCGVQCPRCKGEWVDMVKKAKEAKGKTEVGLDYVVIDHEGSPSLDDDAEGQSFDEFNQAIKRAKELAAINPGLPVNIYTKLATVKAKVDKPEVSMVGEKRK